jgi:hypothetical protein
MITRFFCRLFFSLLLLPILNAAPPSIQKGLLTVATTAVDGSGQSWAYLRWHSTDSSLPFGSAFTISRKDSAPAVPGTFILQGSSELATEASIAKVQLSRAQALGQNITALSLDVKIYYQMIQNNHQSPAVNAAPTPVPSVEAMLAAMVQQARNDAKTASALRQMAITHPAVALCIGEAWAGRINVPVGQAVTFELRHQDSVVASTSINAGLPVELLAPGGAVQVPDSSSKGDRVIKLRWATSDALRRQLPLISGFSVYRVSDAQNTSLGWANTPPTLSQLKTYAQKVSSNPITMGKFFNAASVADFSTAMGDSLTYYFLDDNERYQRNAAGAVIGTAFADGEAFSYYVTALDLLGREGAVSPVGNGVACIRIPPLVPAEFSLREENHNPDNSPVNQGIRLSWKANGNDDGNLTHQYQIFRGTTAIDFSDPASYPAPHATLTHAPDANGMMSWRDDTMSPGSGDVQTYWYALRAVHISPVAPNNFSRLSPRLYGSLKTYLAPPPPSGAAMKSCSLTGLYVPSPDSNLLVPISEVVSEGSNYRAILPVTRKDKEVEWIEIRWMWDSADTNTPFTRYEFTEDDEITIPFSVPLLEEGIRFEARAGSSVGSVSRTVNRLFSPKEIDGINSTTAMRLPLEVYTLTLKEIRLNNPKHVEMFWLKNSSIVELTSVQSLGSEAYFALPADSLPNGTPLIITSGSQTVDAVEAGGGSLVFTDLLSLGHYIAYRPIVGSCAPVHLAEAADGTVQPLRIRLLFASNNIGEYRILRSVDDQEPSLIAQGDGSALPVNAADIIRADDSIPATASTVRYFGQTFNRAGIGSALIPLGDRVIIARKNNVVPTLKAPRAIGTSMNPQVRLEWFCPSAGLERFEVLIQPKVSSAAPTPPLAGSLHQRSIPANTLRMVAEANSVTKVFSQAKRSGLTAPIGRGLADGPEFFIEQSVIAGQAYTISIKSISNANVKSSPSREYTFTWSTPPAPVAPGPEPMVAWPARTIPSVTTWSQMMQATLLASIVSPGTYAENPVGVRIGRIGYCHVNLSSAVVVYSDTQNTGRQYCRVSLNRFRNYRGLEPESYLLARGAEFNDPIYSLGQSDSQLSPSALDRMLPIVLYRQQISNARFPNVSGDVIQVSPLIEKIAHLKNVSDGLLYLRDPYIGVTSHVESFSALHSTPSYLDLHLLDTRPVSKGATYHYTIVRLDSVDGEVAEVIDAGNLTIPE